MYCSCGNSNVAKINGKYKRRKDHPLCLRCFKTQQNKMAKNDPPLFAWEERNNILSLLKEFPEILLSSNPYVTEHSNQINCKIIITDYKSQIELENTNYSIPSLNYDWNDKTLKYVNHWLAKVVDDEVVKGSRQILICGFGNWLS
jgi:hypothetical protein